MSRKLSLAAAIAIFATAATAVLASTPVQAHLTTWAANVAR
jgi:hypothetical protein